MSSDETECVFCQQIKSPNKEQFFVDSSALFIAKWDINPERPGHALVIPLRHVQFLHELNEQELEALAPAVEKAEEIISKTNLTDMYNSVFSSPPTEESKEFIKKAIDELKTVNNRPPDGFNNGINDGPAAGQAIHHLHWHIIPRWKGDMPNPEGGMRHMFDDQSNSGSKP